MFSSGGFSTDDFGLGNYISENTNVPYKTLEEELNDGLRAAGRNIETIPGIGTGEWVTDADGKLDWRILRNKDGVLIDYGDGPTGLTGGDMVTLEPQSQNPLDPIKTKDTVKGKVNRESTWRVDDTSKKWYKPKQKFQLDPDFDDDVPDSGDEFEDSLDDALAEEAESPNSFTRATEVRTSGGGDEIIHVRDDGTGSTGRRRSRSRPSSAR